jgi:hypothetical protein
MRNRAARTLACLLPAILGLFLVRNAPALANRDDFLRLYFGGYVGCATLRGGEAARLLHPELAAAGASFGDEYRASRFKVAQTPYAPLTLALVCGAERVRAWRPEVGMATWALGVQTVSWLALLAAAAVLVWTRLPSQALAAFVVAGLSLVWMHVHTNPLLPSPRAMACLGTSLALALVITGRSEGWAHACAIAAALSHPYNQAINLPIAIAFVVAAAGTPATAGWRPASAARVAATGIMAVGVGLAVVRWASPGPGASVDEMWGYRDAGLLANWAANRAAVYRLLFAVGVPLTALVLRYAGWARALVVAGSFGLTVAVPAFVWPAGLYPGEMSNRVGGAWVAALFALCLRADLVPDFSAIGPRLQKAVAAAVLLMAAAGAVPEAAGIRNAPHYAPWLRPPRVETMPGVERACLAIMARTGRP